MSPLNRIIDKTSHRVRLDGHIDLSRRHELDDIVAEFARSGRSGMIVQFRDVDSCDSTGLSLLVRLEHIAASRGGHVVVTGARPQVRRVFDVTGLSRFLQD